MAKAYQWASRIIVVSFEMVLPGLAGYWVDWQIGTVPLLLVLGLLAGCIGAVWHLVRMTNTETVGQQRRDKHTDIQRTLDDT